MNFDQAVEFILRHEGGYVNNPKDPGGETNFGISKRAYPKVDIKALTKEKAKAIYHLDYWDRLRIGELHPEVRLMMLDCAVNQGQTRAAMMAQRIVGVKADGKMGPATIKAINELEPSHFLSQMSAQRLIAYNHHPEWETFGKGWGKRLLDCVLTSLA